MLITRPEPGATETAARLVALGICPIIAPVLSIAVGKLAPPQRVTATLLTSRNAVRACPQTLVDYPVFAVGTATAAAASEAGFRQISNADGDAAALAEIIASTLSPKNATLFFPVGQGQGRALAKSLRHLGFRVVRRVAYRTMAVKALPDYAVTLLRQRDVAAAMFFSGETSRHFVRLVQEAALIDTFNDVDAVSISQGAAVALRLLRWRCIKVAAKPNQDAMLALLNHD